MCLQLTIKKPPGYLYDGHPRRVVKALIDTQFLVATNSELIAAQRSDLIDTTLAVDINQIVSSCIALGYTGLAHYWKKYLANHPDDNFLLFSVDKEEVELSY